jgi:hypothetical protein
MRAEIVVGVVQKLEGTIFEVFTKGGFRHVGKIVEIDDFKIVVQATISGRRRIVGLDDIEGLGYEVRVNNI